MLQMMECIELMLILKWGPWQLMWRRVPCHPSSPLYRKLQMRQSVELMLIYMLSSGKLQLSVLNRNLVMCEDLW